MQYDIYIYINDFVNQSCKKYQNLETRFPDISNGQGEKFQPSFDEK